MDVLDVPDLPQYPRANGKCPEELYEDGWYPNATSELVRVSPGYAYHSKPSRHVKYVEGSPKKPKVAWNRREPKKRMSAGTNYLC
jgi:hypothetical protein